MRSIVACNKSLSVDDRLCDIQGIPRDTVYPWGKGAHKQKSEHYRLRQCDLKSTVCDVAPLLRKLCLLQIPHLHQKRNSEGCSFFIPKRGFCTAKAVPLLCNVNPFGLTLTLLRKRPGRFLRIPLSPPKKILQYCSIFLSKPEVWHIVTPTACILSRHRRAYHHGFAV